MMITRRMHLRQQLRSVRVSALSEEERRAEMRAAEARHEAGQESPDAGGAPSGSGPAAPRIAGG